jgi:hypothetical protein
VLGTEQKRFAYFGLSLKLFQLWGQRKSASRILVFPSNYFSYGDSAKALRVFWSFPQIIPVMGTEQKRFAYFGLSLKLFQLWGQR